MREYFDPHNMEQSTVQAGKFFESAVFKKCTGETSDKYMSYKDSMDWVRKHQPKKDLRNPEAVDSPQFSKLKLEISAKLPKVDEVLKFYTAIGSVLDTMHGIDGFFELGNSIVTVDLTLNERKEVAKADVVILADKNLGMTDEVIEYASTKIVEKFKEKLNYNASINTSKLVA